MSGSGYVVLLKTQELLEFPRLAEALATIRKQPVQDMVNVAKAAWGILGEGLDEAAARDLAGRLGAEGLDAVAVPAGLMEDPPPALRALRAEIETESLSLLGEAGSWMRVPWTRVVLVAAAGFRQVMSKAAPAEGPGMVQKMVNLGIFMTTGLPIQVGPKKRESPKAVEQADLVLFLDLIFREPDGRARIDAQNFDYSCLRERMAYSAFENFKQLVGEAVRMAPEALRSRGARVMLAGRPLREMGYQSLADIERESRWLLTLRALKLA